MLFISDTEWCGLFRTSNLPEASLSKEEVLVLLFYDGRDLRMFIFWSEKVNSKVEAEDTGIEGIIARTRF